MLQETKPILDTSFYQSKTRHSHLIDHFNIKPIEPICNDEFIKTPIDLPWNDLEKDTPLAFEKFGWYGMIHRMRNDWTRSKLYGGLGLTYNPNYVFNIPKHAQGLGQPRSVDFNMDPSIWLETLREYNHDKHKGENIVTGLNTYDDPLGLHAPTEVTKFRSLSSIFTKLKRPIFQGRLAELRAKDHGTNLSNEEKELTWHTDEQNEIVARLLIPICYSEDYYIEFKESGTKLYFEPGYAYHWNTLKIHRWAFNYHPKIKNRTCVVVGWSPWLDFDGVSWSTNEYCGKMHPTDMIKNGLVI